MLYSVYFVKFFREPGVDSNLHFNLFQLRVGATTFDFDWYEINFCNCLGHS